MKEFELNQFRRALLLPHPEALQDPETKIMMRCSRCGKHAYGLRSEMKEAMEEHWRSVCPVRHTKADTPLEARIVYPRS